MRRMIALLLCAALMCAMGGTALADAKPQVVVTTFPIYDWVRSIAWDTVDITMLLDNGVDLHSYQPTAQDIMRIATCDLMIYIGGESDDWVPAALATAVNASRQTLNLMEALGDRALEEELVEGMEADEDEDEEECMADEHIWLSLQNAQVLVQAITTALSDINPAQAEVYAANASAYEAALAELDAAYAEMVAGADYHTVLFGDRFPFRYLTADYGLSYYAAFSGCSAETEASFQTIVFLAGKLDELGLPAILTIEGTNHRIAETIVSTTAAKNQRLLTLNSMQGTTMKDANEGTTYLDVMTANLDILRSALYQ